MPPRETAPASDDTCAASGSLGSASASTVAACLSTMFARSSSLTLTRTSMGPEAWTSSTSRPGITRSPARYSGSTMPV